MKAVLGLALLGLTPLLGAEAQFATASAGMLVSNRVPDVIVELHAETPPFGATRGWITLSWTDQSAKPTVIQPSSMRSCMSKEPAQDWEPECFGSSPTITSLTRSS